MNHNGSNIESRLWAAADELRANSKLKSSEYSVPVLGLVFLRYADHKFQAAAKELAGAGGGRRKIGPADYQAKGVLYLPAAARFSALIQMPEGANIGAAINDAMRAIEADNPDLKDVLPKTYNRFENALLKELLKTMNSVPMDIEGDAFGRIYEYFLGNFARAEGQKGGEFFTPTAIVQLIVGIIEPFHGRIFDPACGSGGMFVQSARFVLEHKSGRTLTPGPSPTGRGEEAYDGTISIYGQEKVAETVRLGKMNLAVHGLAGDIRQGNAYYEDLHRSVGKFDFVMANPPFNVDRVDKDRLKDDPRFSFGLPRTDNANYLWIQIFYSALADTGRSGFVMANSASDARGSELDIRRQLIEARAVDVMVAVGSNFFYTVTLPCTLWFFDMAKQALPPSPQSSPKGRGSQVPSTSSVSPAGRDKSEGATHGRGGGGEGRGARYSDTVLFVDARHLYRQIDRAHRDWTPAQIEFLANIARLYRGEKPENLHESADLMAEHGFLPSTSSLSPSGRDKSEGVKQGRWAGGEGAPSVYGYRDIPGLCKIATIQEIEEQGWSLNPGRYVGVAARAEEDFNFKERLEEQNEELEILNAEARELEQRIADNIRLLLEADL